MVKNLPAMWEFNSVQLLSYVRLCDPMNCSTPGLPVHHQFPEFTQTHVHWVGDAIQPSHPLSSPSPALNLSQHQGLFKWGVISPLRSIFGYPLFWGVHLSVSYIFAFSYWSWGSQGKDTEVVCHSLLQWTTFCQTSPPWPIRLGWPHTAWLSFSELDKAVVHVIRLTSFLRLWFQSICPLMPSLSNAGGPGSNPRLGRFPREWNGYPSMDRRA